MMRTCRGCGLVQTVPSVPTAGAVAAARSAYHCHRCDRRLPDPAGRAWRQTWTRATATAALILYPLAVSLPILEVSKLGRSRETGILEGTARLLTDGHVFVGSVVLVCSVLLPLVKLVSLLVLSGGGGALRRRHRALTFRVVEWTGRYGMLDVLCVAVLVAVLKLGDVVDVTVGPGALVFGSCVLLSLFATAIFDPHDLWEEEA